MLSITEKAGKIGIPIHNKVLNAVGVLKGKEEFKECNTCGKMLLRSSENFVKKSRSKDGFTGRCKRCDRKVREGKKEK